MEKETLLCEYTSHFFSFKKRLNSISLKGCRKEKKKSENELCDIPNKLDNHK